MMGDLGILWAALLSDGYLFIPVIGLPVIVAVLLTRWVSQFGIWVRLAAGFVLVLAVGFFALMSLGRILDVANPIRAVMADTAENLGPLALPLFLLPALAQTGEALKNFGATLLGSALLTGLAAVIFCVTLWRHRRAI